MLWAFSLYAADVDRAAMDLLEGFASSSAGS
jgi:hypothetical protein